MPSQHSLHDTEPEVVQEVPEKVDEEPEKEEGVAEQVKEEEEVGEEIEEVTKEETENAEVRIICQCFPEENSVTSNLCCVGPSRCNCSLTPCQHPS